MYAQYVLSRKMIDHVGPILTVGVPLSSSTSPWLFYVLLMMITNPLHCKPGGINPVNKIKKKTPFISIMHG